MYEIVQVNIPEKEKFNPLSIKLSHADLIGNDSVLVTKSQYDGMRKALNSKRKGFILVMNKNQVEANVNAASKLDSSAVWSSLFSETVQPSAAKNAAKNVIEEVADKIMGENKIKKLKLHLASKVAGNTGLDSEIEKLMN